MAEKMTMLNAGALEDMLHAKALEMETDLSNIRAAYSNIFFSSTCAISIINL